MTSDEGVTFAQLLDRLFTSTRARDRAEYSYREVAAGVLALTGVDISASYVWQLRSGVRDNPTKRHIEGLAAFFGVPPAYFFDGEEGARVRSELDSLVALRDSGVSALALRATGLSPRSLELISAMIEQSRRIEGLDSAVPEAEGSSPASPDGPGPSEDAAPHATRRPGGRGRPDR